MKRKKAVLISLLSVAAVVIIAGAALIAHTNLFNKDYDYYITCGHNYLEQGDYDRAINAYSTALKMDEYRTEAYSGLSDAYIMSGQNEMAHTMLALGIEKTGSITLEVIMQDKFDDYSADLLISNNEAESSAEDKADDGEIVLNTDVLTFIAQATFQDYENSYGVTMTSSNNGIYCYLVNRLDIVIAFDNTGSTVVINSNTGNPYENTKPDYVTFNNLALLFGKNEENVSDISGINGISNYDIDNNICSFTSSGCELSIEIGDDNTITNTSWNRVIPQDAAVSTGSVALSGTVIDVTNGVGIGNVDIKIYEGSYTSNNYVVATTDSNGYYSVEVESGDHYVCLTRTGYITAEYNIYVPNAASDQEDFEMSPEMQADQIRIVLTWDGMPTDLDSHLVGSTDSGKDIHTYFADRTAYDSNGGKVAELDLDDMDGYGPETTTIYDINGTYEFIVYDYTQSGIMSNSNAQVKIYQGDSLVKTIDICSDCDNYWNVVLIDHGQITVLNEPG